MYEPTLDLLRAELSTAESATPGHPLVNTTDQWTNTTLRRAIRMAAEADADYIAIPHGDTVLSYNPGDEAGMRGFYGSRSSEGIVPKNLRKMMEKIDKDAAKPIKVEKLETSQGMQGWQGDKGTYAAPNEWASVDVKKAIDPRQTGFTLFKLTDKVKQEVLDEGQPLFAFGGVQSPEANISAYTEAVVMNRRGASAQEILDATGWYKDKSGKWKFWNEDEPDEPQTVAESRAHARRMEMTPEERKATPPWMEQPQAEDIFANTKRIYSHAKDVVRAELSKPTPRLTATKNGVTAVLTRSMDGSGGFRITSFRDGEPIGHRDYKADDQGINLAAQDMVSHGLRPSEITPAPAKAVSRSTGGSVTSDRSFIDRALDLARRARKH